MDYAITLRTGEGRIASTALSRNSLIRTANYSVILGEKTLQIEGAKVRSVSFERDKRSPDARLILPALRVQGVVARSGKPVD